MTAPIDWSRMALPDPAADLARARMTAQAQLCDWIEGQLAPFTAGVPLAEQQGWPVKTARARAHLEGLPDAAILLEAQANDEDPDALARRILDRAEEFALTVATLTGLRRAAERAIAGAATPAAVEEALRLTLLRGQDQRRTPA